jgi:hypothetical protein
VVFYDYYNLRTNIFSWISLENIPCPHLSHLLKSLPSHSSEPRLVKHADKRFPSTKRPARRADPASISLPPRAPHLPVAGLGTLAATSWRAAIVYVTGARYPRPHGTLRATMAASG